MLTRARLRLVFFFCKVLSTDEQLSRYLGGGSLGSTRRCRIVYLQGTVVETGAFHYCFPSVKFDLFSYPLLATETNHALIYFPFFVVVFFFWLHNHLERTLCAIHPATGWHNSPERLGSFNRLFYLLLLSLSVFLFRLLKTSARKMLLRQQ